MGSFQMLCLECYFLGKISQVANLLWPFLGTLGQDQGVLEARTQAVGLGGHLAGDEWRLGDRALGSHGVLLWTGGPLGRLWLGDLPRTGGPR